MNLGIHQLLHSVQFLKPKPKVTNLQVEHFLKIDFFFFLTWDDVS